MMTRGKTRARRRVYEGRRSHQRTLIRWICTNGRRWAHPGASRRPDLRSGVVGALPLPAAALGSPRPVCVSDSEVAEAEVSSGIRAITSQNTCCITPCSKRVGGPGTPRTVASASAATRGGATWAAWLYLGKRYRHADGRDDADAAERGEDGEHAALWEAGACVVRAAVRACAWHAQTGLRARVGVAACTLWTTCGSSSMPGPTRVL